MRPNEEVAPSPKTETTTGLTLTRLPVITRVVLSRISHKVSSCRVSTTKTGSIDLGPSLFSRTGSGTSSTSSTPTGTTFTSMDSQETIPASPRSVETALAEVRKRRAEDKALDESAKSQ